MMMVSFEHGFIPHALSLDLTGEKPDTCQQTFAHPHGGGELRMRQVTRGPVAMAHLLSDHMEADRAVIEGGGLSCDDFNVAMKGAKECSPWLNSLPLPLAIPLTV
eukprot:Polyplicarium_translucidae@DN3320_c3_g2_i3.p6